MRCILRFLPILFALPSTFATPVVTGELRVWHPITITFDGPATQENATPNPFTDFRLNVTFTQGSKSYQVPGFYAADGDAANSGASAGGKWRVHFTPDAPGEWSYTVSLKQGTMISIVREGLDPEPPDVAPWAPLDGETGSVTVAPSDKSGRDFRALGRLIYTGEHHFRTAGNQRTFVKTGMDSPENFLGYADFDQTFKDPNPPKLNPNKSGPRSPLGIIHQFASHVADWNVGDPVWTQRDGVPGSYGKGIIGAINYLAEQGVNSHYFLTYNIDAGDGADTWPWRAVDERLRFDCSKLDQWDIVFRHMQEKGLLMYVIQQERENDKRLGPLEAPKNGDKPYNNLNDGRKLYYRELIARFAYHPGLVWNIGEENTNKINANVNLPSDFAAYIRSLDPYDHPIGIHSGNGDSVLGMAADFYGDPNFEFMSMQADIADYADYSQQIVSASALAGRKFVVWADEQNPGEDDSNAYRKLGAWSAYMGGAGGVEWYAGGDDQDLEDYRAPVVAEKLFDYRSLHFFFSTLADPAGLGPDSSLVTGASNLCLADPGNRYVAYLPNGGACEIDLSAAAGGDQFHVRWYNPRTGGVHDGGGRLEGGSVLTAAGGGVRNLGVPPSDTALDWAVLITRALPGGGSTFGDWANSIDWQGAAPIPDGNLDLDPWTNLQEYAFDLDPLSPDIPFPALDFTVISGESYLQWQYRWNQSATDLQRSFQGSNDLTEFATIGIDGTNATDQVVTTNPDGDGSAEIRQLSVKTAGENAFFLRLHLNLGM